jgi:teichuronic acid biosynthesis glycosyltransferase TuaH
MTGDRLVVIVSGKPWDGVRGADRHIAEQLVRYARVLWVDPPVSPATPARYRPDTGRALRPRLRPVADRIDRLSPVALPGLTRPGIRAATWPLVRVQLRWALRRLGRRPHAVLACSFDDVLGRYGAGTVSVLYGTDDWVAGAELMGLAPGWLRQQERRALRRANVVVAVTPELATRWRDLGAQPVLIPNGCDPAAYSDVDSRPVPAVAAELPAPVVGLVGRLSGRIDVGLLEDIADRGMSLLVVGPQEGEWEPERWPRLASRPNVRHVDRVPFTELPGYLRAMDVGITPYRDTAFNRSSFPLKTLEYLAAGRPAVSTDLPATRWLAADGTDGRGLVTIADRVHFVDAVQSAASVPRSAELTRRRRRFAARHSWQQRADVLAAAIGLTAEPPGAAAGADRAAEPAANRAAEPAAGAAGGPASGAVEPDANATDARSAR